MRGFLTQNSLLDRMRTGNTIRHRTRTRSEGMFPLELESPPAAPSRLDVKVAVHD